MEHVSKELELVEVTTEDGKATLTFLDEEAGEIRDVNFNKKVYDENEGKFVDNEEKAKQVEEWSQEYFDVPFDKLGTKVGEVKQVFFYDNFNSLWEVEITNKFEKDDEGSIFETEITEVVDDGKGIHIYFEQDGKRYESKMQYADYMENKNQWFTNPQKKRKQFKKFEDKFGVPVEKADEIVGKKVMCEVKVAFGKFPYVEIKKPRWAK